MNSRAYLLDSVGTIDVLHDLDEILRPDVAWSTESLFALSDTLENCVTNDRIARFTGPLQAAKYIALVRTFQYSISGDKLRLRSLAERISQCEKDISQGEGVASQLGSDGCELKSFGIKRRFASSSYQALSIEEMKEVVLIAASSTIPSSMYARLNVRVFVRSLGEQEYSYTDQNGTTSIEYFQTYERCENQHESELAAIDKAKEARRNLAKFRDEKEQLLPSVINISIPAFRSFFKNEMKQEVASSTEMVVSPEADSDNNHPQTSQSNSEQSPSNSDSVASGITQPKVIKAVTPEYPDEAKDSGIEGTVWVKVLIDKDGIAEEAKVMKSDAEVLNNSAIKAARQTIFSPALWNGKPIQYWVAMPFRFQIGKE